MIRIEDDGQRVIVDLHGVSVERALEVADAAVIEAARRGRSTVRFIHGASTYERGADHTIRGELEHAVDDGRFERHVTSVVEEDTSMLFGLAPAPRPVPGRIHMSDIW